MIVVGNTKAGKTTLVKRCTSNCYTPGTEATVTPNFTPITLESRDGVKKRFQFWDTAGQERFASMSQIFFRGASIAFICFEAVDPDPTDSVRRWWERVIQIEPECSIIVVATKVDLLEPGDRHRVSAIGHEIASTISARGFFETSSLTGEGVDLLFQECANIQELSKPQMQKMPSRIVLEEKEEKKCC